MEENEEASSYKVTVVRGRYHGPTMALAEPNFLLFLYSMGMASQGHPSGSTYTEMRVKCSIKLVQNPANVMKNHSQA